MKKTANHSKPFITALGIAFAFLALVVLYFAFAKGGLDIRSRAGLVSCKGAGSSCGLSSECCSKYCLRGLCAGASLTKTPTPKPTVYKTPTSKPTIYKTPTPRPPTPTPTKRPTSTPSRRPTPTIASQSGTFGL